MAHPTASSQDMLDLEGLLGTQPTPSAALPEEVESRVSATVFGGIDLVKHPSGIVPTLQ